MSHPAAHRIKGELPILSGGVRWFVLLFVVIAVGAGCGGETLGALRVTIRLQTPAGVSRSCVDLGAERVELALFAEPGDVVPHDLATVDCDATASGWAVFGLAVTARTYHRVVMRFITSTGTTVGVCGPEGRMDAELEQNDIRVEAGVLGRLDFLLVGDSQPCAE